MTTYLSYEIITPPSPYEDSVGVINVNNIDEETLTSTFSAEALEDSSENVASMNLNIEELDDLIVSLNKLKDTMVQRDLHNSRLMLSLTSMHTQTLTGNVTDINITDNGDGTVSVEWVQNQGIDAEILNSIDDFPLYVPENLSELIEKDDKVQLSAIFGSLIGGVNSFTEQIKLNYIAPKGAGE